jgi:hypothetical protein
VANLILLFHHLIAVHQWGWTITLNPDGTTTATSPSHRKTLHSHSPPDSHRPSDSHRPPATTAA